MASQVLDLGRPKKVSMKKRGKKKDERRGEEGSYILTIQNNSLSTSSLLVLQVLV